MSNYPLTHQPTLWHPEICFKVALLKYFQTVTKPHHKRELLGFLRKSRDLFGKIMADAECLQLEDGYAKIVHGVFDALARYRMTNNCTRVLMIVLRMTYGFGKKEAQISIDTFVRRTGLKRQNVRRALNALLYHGIVRIPSDSKRIPSYSYQKYSSKWKPWEGDRKKPKKESHRIPKRIPSDSPSYKNTVKDTVKDSLGLEPAQDHKSDPPPDPPKPPKKKRKTTTGNHHFDQFWAAYPRKVKKIDAEKAWKQTSKLRPKVADIIKAVEAQKKTQGWKKDGGQFIPYPATWLRAGCWDDVIENKEEERDERLRNAIKRHQKNGGLFRQRTQ